MEVICVGVSHGDTITILNSQKIQYKIRFAGIDAPELKQAFGNKAKQNLPRLIFAKEVTLLGSVEIVSKADVFLQSEHKLGRGFYE